MTSNTQTPEQDALAPSTTPAHQFYRISGKNLLAVVEGIPTTEALEHASYFLSLADGLLTGAPDDLDDAQVMASRTLIELAKGFVDAATLSGRA